MTYSATQFYESSIGKKVVMAVSGVVVFGFVVVHILGNLQLFAGPERLNHYAATLQSLGAIKWAIRGILAVSVAVHMVSAAQVTLQSWAARKTRYVRSTYNATTYAARTMRVGGPLIGLFVIYHLLHLTTGQLHPVADGFAPDANGVVNVYNNVVYGFRDPLAAGIYMVVMVMIGLHLYHGLFSMFQSLGLNHPRWNGARQGFAATFALFVTLAGISLPAAVLAGVVGPV